MSTPSKTSRFHLVRVVIPITLLAVALGVYLQTEQVESALANPYPMTSAPDFEDSLSKLPVWGARPDRDLAGVDVPVEFTFKRGETLSSILGGLGLEPEDARTLIEALILHVDVRRLRPVDRYAALVDEAGEFQGLRVTLDGKGRAEVRRQEDSWQSSWSEFVEVSDTRVVKGVLEGSLESSIVRAGGEAVVAYVMADVLQWDLDFNRDLRVGDEFDLLYERVYLDGDFHRVGDILALRYANEDRQLEAYRFGEDGGHYDGEGRPLRKLFLKSPLRYSRVTSGFSTRRFHPVLKSYRPHYGVDYGAPVGTPVRVTGSGVVKSAGWDGGGGKTVKVRHPNGYVTAYLHLSRFAKGISSGSRVSQGDVIGYVGSTGLATGPHLDYRMQKNGRWLDPRTLRSKPAAPIPPDQLTEFESMRERFRRTMESAAPTDEGTPGQGDQIANVGID